MKKRAFNQLLMAHLVVDMVNFDFLSLVCVNSSFGPEIYREYPKSNLSIYQIGESNYYIFIFLRLAGNRNLPFARLQAISWKHLKIVCFALYD